MLDKYDSLLEKCWQEYLIYLVGKTEVIPFRVPSEDYKNGLRQ